MPPALPPPDPKRAMQAAQVSEEVFNELRRAWCADMRAYLDRAGITGDRIDLDKAAGPLYFYGGPGVDSGSGANPLDDTTGGQGGGSGPVRNSGVIKGIEVLPQVSPTTDLTITVYIGGVTLGTLTLAAGQGATTFLPGDIAGLTRTELQRGEVQTVDFTGTDGTVAGVHVGVILRCDVLRGPEAA